MFTNTNKQHGRHQESIKLIGSSGGYMYIFTYVMYLIYVIMIPTFNSNTFTISSVFYKQVVKCWRSRSFCVQHSQMFRRSWLKLNYDVALLDVSFCLIKLGIF